MSKLTFVTMAVVVLLVLNGVLIFVIFTDKSRSPRQRVDEIIIDRLQLHGDQIERFEELKHAHRAEVASAHDSIRMLKKILIVGLKTSLPDAKQAERVAAAISNQHKRIELATFRHFNSLRELCNARQKRLFDEFIQEIAMALDRPHSPRRP
ncbi:MAG TPA: hypothetical protein VEB86_14795 [Chryseosolibacter sp.]|nr:hypothetical protein [Chryseosolibacter sp.]